MQAAVQEPGAWLHHRFDEAMRVRRRFFDQLGLCAGFDHHDNALVRCRQVDDAYRLGLAVAGWHANRDAGAEQHGGDEQGLEELCPFPFATG